MIDIKKRRWIAAVPALVALGLIAAPAARAEATGAIGTGNWESTSTWTGGAVPGSSSVVYIGSTYPSGATATATVTLTADEAASSVNLGNGSGSNGTLNLGGHRLAVTNSITFGNGGAWSFNEGSGGSFTAATANINGANTFTFGSNDAVATLNLNGGSNVTTAATGNVTDTVNVNTGSTLTLGANMSLSSVGSLNVQDSGSTLNMAGHNISEVESVFFGYYGSSAVTLQNLGDIATLNLYIGHGTTFNLTSADTVSSFYLSAGTSTLTNNVADLYLSNGASATTTATGSATNYVSVDSGSTLTLGANISLSDSLNVQDSGSTLNAMGHGLTASTLFVGWSGSAAVTVENLGQVRLDNLYVGNNTAGSDLTLHGGDAINTLIDLKNGSVLTVNELGGIGLSLNGTSLSSLTIDATSSMDLAFDGPGWAFRWADPSGGNWISTLGSLIAGGQIKIDMPAGDSLSVYNQDGYTYIGVTGAAVPEPSSLVLALLGMAGVGLGARRFAARGGKGTKLV